MKLIGKLKNEFIFKRKKIFYFFIKEIKLSIDIFISTKIFNYYIFTIFFEKL